MEPVTCSDIEDVDILDAKKHRDIESLILTTYLQVNHGRHLPLKHSEIIVRHIE